MASTQNPTSLAAGGVSEKDRAGASINPKSKSPLTNLQAVHLTRRCAISFAMAAAVAPLYFGEGAQ